MFVTCEARVSGPGRAVVVVVEDDGTGVAPEHRDQIFLDGTSFRAGGTGQGLALVREVVEQEFRGEVGVTASRHGGARFELRIPIPLEGET